MTKALLVQNSSQVNVQIIEIYARPKICVFIFYNHPAEDCGTLKQDSTQHKPYALLRYCNDRTDT